MASIKRIILTRQQLNEVLKEENTTTVQLNTTGNTITSLTNAVTSNQPEINNAGKYGDVNLHISNQKLVGSNDSIPTQHVEVEKGQNVNQAIQQQVNPTVLSDGGDVEVSGDGISEYKSFSKRQIEEARLKKIHEGYKITKRKLREHWEEKPNDDANQWNEEYEMFMDGLKHGDYEVMNDVLFVQVFKGRTPDNDPRYVYIRKGENRLHDDHFYIRNSPPLNDLDLEDIYYNAGWEDVLPELIDYNGFEMYENKNGINPEPKTFIVSWMAELTAPKKGKVGGNMLIKAVDKKEAEKRFKKRLFANGYNGEPVSFMLVDLKIEEADNVNEGKIKINPKNKGKFTATKKRTGKSTEELTHSKNPLTRKRAIFAQNIKKWNKK